MLSGTLHGTGLKRLVPPRAPGARRVAPASRTRDLVSTARRRGTSCHAVQQEAPKAPPGMPPSHVVPVDIKTVQLDGGTKLFQCHCSAYLRFEAEYGRKRGTTSNAYLLLDGTEGILIDVPRKEYLDVFCKEIEKETATVHTIVVTHLNPDIVRTLAAVVRVIKRPSDRPLTLLMSKPAQTVLNEELGRAECETLADPEQVAITVAAKEDEIRVGRRTLQCIATTTPRYPELLCLYERTTRRLFSSCFFSAHVNPQRGVTGTDGTDAGGWAAYGSDWEFFFDCMFAPVAPQAAAAVNKLSLSVATQSGSPLLALKRLLGGGKGDTSGSRPVASILPRHGPVVRRSVVQLVNEYTRWIETQQANIKNAKVAVLYASAYGNTASLAQAISRGITKAGVGVEMVNLEQSSRDEAKEVVKSAQGFCIGSPTLGGHMPTQVSSALGFILRDSDLRTLPFGVYGSFGWSGEAVDILAGRLGDAGFQAAFKPIKVKFRADAKMLQVCEESGTDLAQKILKTKRTKRKQSEKRSVSSLESTQITGAQQAMGRVVGSLSIVTAKDDEAESAMLASWLSQASFEPPGLTVAVKKDRAAESLMVTGNSFNVNILKQGGEGPVMKALLKNFEPGEDRFAAVAHHRSENDCVVIEDAVSCLECTVTQRMNAGDHIIVYGTISKGEVLDAGAVSAVHHRKAGNTY